LLQAALDEDQPPTYFCNPSAYGKAITNRSTDQASNLWRATGNPVWNRWLLKKEIPTFLQVFEIFAYAKWDNSKEMAFPSFGPLVSMLIASDYAIAGAVQMPSPEEMGQVIWRLKAGGYRGLTNLGFAVGTQEETVASFCTYHNYLQQNISRERQMQMKFSVFTSENGLCKHHRLSLAQWESLYN